MANMKYVFGPVPSRRLGESLGISPIPEKTCNYSCTYCQLGRTNKLVCERKDFFPLQDILDEFKQCKKDNIPFDIVTVVGEGEPTLYSRLGELIKGLKSLTEKPVAVITNGALLSDEKVREELMEADIVLPSMDAYNLDTFKKIDRPHGRLNYDEIYEGLIEFTHSFKGQVWMEVMLIDGVNNSDEAIEEFKNKLSKVRYDRLYINTPVRPPAEGDVKMASPESIKKAVEVLGGVSIEMLASGSFHSDIENPYDAILSIASRHPMNQFEISSFLSSRKLEKTEVESIFARLEKDERVTVLDYKGIVTYRAKKG